jgi:putative transposase
VFIRVLFLYYFLLIVPKWHFLTITKLYKSKKNWVLYDKITLAGEIYNHCIALHKRYYRLYRKSLNVYALINHITKLKKMLRYKHWCQLGSQAIQDVVERIDKSYKLFFRNQKHRIKSGTPHFKKRTNYKSFTLKQAGYKLLDGNRIKIGNKIYKYFKSQEIEGNVKTLTIKRDKLGDIYLYIVTDAENLKVAPRTGEIVGFDFGLKTFLTVSNGEDIESPLFFHQNNVAVRKASRKLSKKQRLSNNRRKARKSLERLHKRIANQRSDFHWKLANKLTDKYDFMFFENLNMQGMKRHWGKKISDLSFSSFLLKLKYLASVKGKTVFCIGRFEPSSKTCSVCGYIYKDLELKEREWRCPECETLHNRDRNASYNILRVGASTLGLGDVSPLQTMAISA